MADHLRAYPPDLWVSADQVAMHNEELRTAHARADARIAATSSGWAGASAVAMRAKVAEWQAFTQQMCAKLDEHHAHFRSTGNAYQQAEERSAKTLET